MVDAGLRTLAIGDLERRRREEKEAARQKAEDEYLADEPLYQLQETLARFIK